MTNIIINYKISGIDFQGCFIDKRENPEDALFSAAKAIREMKKRWEKNLNPRTVTINYIEINTENE